MIAILVAMTENRVIGREGKLPWRIPEEMELFKRLTVGNTVVMGRKTYASLPEKFRPLPKRNNVVISKSLSPQPGAPVCSSIEEGIRTAQALGRDIFIIGGAEIYRQTLPLVDKLYVSLIRKEYPGDTYFPKFNKGDWVEESRKDFAEFAFIIYRRKP